MFVILGGCICARVHCAYIGGGLGNPGVIRGGFSAAKATASVRALPSKYNLVRIVKSSMAVVESNMALVAYFLNEGKRQTI